MAEDKCTCDENKDKELVLHPCPYAEDIWDNHSDVCSCCKFCTQDCANDI